MFTNSPKTGARWIGLVALLTICSIASADEVEISGLTLGRFNSQAYGSTNTLLGLTYDNSTFDNTTVGGNLDLGGNPLPGFNFNNLGSFTLSSSDNVYTGNTFSLSVNFTAPLGITGGTSTVFSDIISGTVKSDKGGVFIDFNNSPQTFTFSNATTMGSFTMAVNDLSVAPGQAASLTAHVTGSEQAVPEPSGLALLGFGGLGLFLGFRRNRTS